MKQTYISFLIQKCFEENTLYGKMPETVEDFDQMFNRKEYERVLKDILLGLNLLEIDEEKFDKTKLI